MKIIYKSVIHPQDQVTGQSIIETVLKKRQIKDIDAFLNPPSPVTIQISDFGFKKEIKKTLSTLEKILKNKKTIVVYTDYDADGITGGAILWETLHHLGFLVMPYVPHRQHEGYGFSITGIDNVKKQFNPALIISVDHGIAAADQIAYATSLGIPIIVTDHHMKQKQIPSAQAIFHIPALSGSGVSYFFSKMIFDHFKNSPFINKKKIGELENHFQNDYTALASIGTIADLVPLVGPSRSIVKHGLAACTRTKRIGLVEVIKQAGISDRKITPYEIGFIIAPRINAIGRLEHAIDALRLLCTLNYEKAYQLAGKVGKLNVDRQDMVKKAVAEAQLMVGKMKKIPAIIILQSDSWHEGIIGLIASRIAEQYFRPTIIMTKSDSYYKGSARSIPVFHITNALTGVKELLLSVGGHQQAAGFSIETKKIPRFVKAIGIAGKKELKTKDLERVMETDFKLPLEKINVNIAKKLEELEPYGMGNPQITFYSEAKILDIKPFGKKKDHLKVYLVGREERFYPVELISFGGTEKWPSLTPGQNVEVVYQIEVDRWGGDEKLRGKLLHIQG